MEQVSNRKCDMFSIEITFRIRFKWNLTIIDFSKLQWFWNGNFNYNCGFVRYLNYNNNNNWIQIRII